METTQINMSLFYVLQSMATTGIEPTIAFDFIQRLTGKNADDLVAELAFHARQAKNGLNDECFAFFKAVFDEALAG
jgi:hypothetical protein